MPAKEAGKGDKKQGSSNPFLCCFAPTDADGDRFTNVAATATTEAKAEDMSDGKPTMLQPGQVAAPKPMNAGTHSMTLVGGPSHLLTPDHVSALASVMPPLERLRDWSLSYSTKHHGTSLATLFRRTRATGQVPTLMVIQDHAGHVFGCYTPEGWRVAPRYYGSGESFVFQLEPSRGAWPWQSLSVEKNDFFQYSTPECLALGGGGHYAIHLDQDLLQGSSDVCGTFGSPCLAARQDFKVVVVEVWQAT